MRKITDIVIHCSATPEGKDFGAASIDRWHKERGWAGIGYHYVVKRDGTIEPGRPLEKAGAHVAGHNANSVGIVYIGGLAKDGKKAKDTRTPEQKTALRTIVAEMRRRFPEARVLGHRDFPGVRKDCPSFDVRTQL
ncbi:N-acetylmuramoyl-L-alanine amidase [Sphingopyxis flava]|uniref:N-acetylmuramoyl-L-alanine amidase n=1 Tax=Sphingopyxis flava TaxID=1507287 RepID=A0A1T5BQZ6_9SPHN|nr:N-acetylmuramoyl-L-alanine amidase [Sphingopyxis flava]SKB49310.1 N-acetylmuramoyl-L-alanine amidase [Sphingopyxis flava]